VNRSATPKLRAYTSVTAFGLVGALVLGRPELAALVAPLAVFLAVGLVLAPDPLYELRVALDPPTAVEGQEVELRVEAHCVRPADRLEIEAVASPGISFEPPSVLLRLRAGEERHLRIGARCDRWGAFAIGDLMLRAHDRLGLFRYESRGRTSIPVKVYPRREQLRTLLRPGHTMRSVGSLVSRELGDGIELAEVRPFRPGDRIHSMNWRASARKGGLWVTDRHPERNADVVIFVDAFTNLVSSDASSLDVAVRAAAAIAEAHLAIRDRVGLVSFGGTLRWLTPGSGRRQFYRIVDALLDTQLSLSYAWKGIDVLPPRTLPPRALVVALSPLMDERALEALFDLRGRGVDLVVLEIPPERFIRVAETDTERLARRIWALKRDVLRHRLERLGVPVGVWREDVAIEEVFGEVRAFRRRTDALHA
jgi:uncharacterized protein (DUF58 family)